MTKKFTVVKWEGMVEVGEGETVPMSRKLHAYEFMLLQTIAMFQMEGEICDSTFDQLANSLPISRRTAVSYMQSLLEFQYEGKHVLTVERPVIRGRQRNVYRLHPNKLFGVYGESFSEPHAPITSAPHTSTGEHGASTKEVTKELTKELKKEEDDSMKNKDIIKVFTDKYKEVYMDDYKIVWSRDNKFTTKFLKSVETLEDNEKKELVETIVSNYSNWTNNSAKYPLSFNTLSLKWVQEKAFKLIEEEKKKVSQIEKDNGESIETTQKSIQSIMSRIKKKGSDSR